jgi:glutamate synthase domain-containing protein 2
MGVAALLALGCNRRTYRTSAGELVDVEDDYAALSTSSGHCAHCHTGRCPVGITTQDPVLESRLVLEHAAESVANFLRATTMEVTALARACGKSDVHHLEPEDLVALTVEAAAMAKLPLAGTGWIPGWPAETER